MKYIVGASIGGLFGLSVPMFIEAQDIYNKVQRQEESQPVDESPQIPIEDSLTLPDNTCGYITYESTDIKEQVKECISYSLPAIPAI